MRQLNDPRGAATVAPTLAGPPFAAWLRTDLAASRWIHADGVRLHAREWPAPNAEAPTLLLLHGYRAHARWWDWIAPAFTDRFHVVALDFSGMGDSGWRDRYDSRTYVRELLAVVDALGVRPIVVGHSFGGSTLARACAQRSDAFARAILLDAWFTLPSHTLPDIEVRLPGPVRPSPDRASLRARYVLAPPQDAPYPQLLEHAAMHSMCERTDGWHWKFDPALPAVINDVRGADVLAGITTPTTYVYGESSLLISRAHAHAIAARLPGAPAPVGIAEAHHHMMFDQPERLIATLQALLA